MIEYPKKLYLVLVNEEHREYKSINWMYADNRWHAYKGLFSNCESCGNMLDKGYILYHKKFIGYCSDCTVVVSPFNVEIERILKNHKNEEF